MNICSDCINVQTACKWKITDHRRFLGRVEDPHFPEFPADSVITGGNLDANYRNPVCVADCALAQFGGQTGDRTVPHVDPEAIEGREMEYEDVALPTETSIAEKLLELLPKYWLDADFGSLEVDGLAVLNSP